MPAIASKTVQRKVPKRALSFAAEAKISSNGDDAKTAPIEILARSSKPIWHWYWGNIVHDMSGMRTNKDRIALDYCHDPGDVIGFGNKFDTTTGDLVISGALTPFKKEDRAEEILHKHGLGVPYEGSIFFGEDAKLEQIMEGVSVTVNGETLEGPLLVVREWTLRGCAVCPYGMDPNTETRLSDSADEKEITVHVFEAETPAQSEQPPAESTETETPPAEESTQDTETPSEESAEGEEGTTPAPVDAESTGQEGEGGATIPTRSLSTPAPSANDLSTHSAPMGLSGLPRV